MRRAPPLCLLLLACALAGCGKEAVPGVRFRILTSTADGPVAGDVQLESLDDGAGTKYDTQPVSSDDATLRVAPGAPEGHYRIVSTQGWGMLWTGRDATNAPLLRGAGHPALVVRMGRPRSLYVASLDPGSFRVGPEWAVDWRLTGSGHEFLPAKILIEDQGDGVVALRFEDSVWQPANELRAVGRMTDGTVTKLVVLQRHAQADSRLPSMILVRACVRAPLRVVLVPEPGVATVPDGTPVRASVTGLPLVPTYEAESFKGIAWFETLATEGSGLRLELPRGGPQMNFDLDTDAWRLRGGVHLTALDRTHMTRAVVIEYGGGYSEARVRYKGGKAYGRVPLWRVPASSDGAKRRVWLYTLPGWQEWWLRTRSGSWVYEAVDVPAPPKIKTVNPRGTEGRACRVRGQVSGAGRGGRVEFRLVMKPLIDDGDPILPARRTGGDGFEAAVTHQGMYEARLPPGRYVIRAIGAGGAGGRPVTMDLGPESEARIDLSAR